MCDFAFVQSEVTATGETVERKFLKKKLKLSDERIAAIRQVIGEFTHEDLSNKGSSKNYFRAIEKVIKMESDLRDLRDLQQHISQA